MPTGALFLVGSLPFLFTVEEEGPSSPAPAARPHLASIRRVLGDRSFLSFLATEVEYVALGSVIAFYANYTTEFCGVTPATASGLFVMLSSLGGMAANAAFG